MLHRVVAIVFAVAVVSAGVVAEINTNDPAAAAGVAPMEGQRQLSVSDKPSFCGGSFGPGDRVKAVVNSPAGASGLAKGAMGTAVCSTTSNPPVLICWDDWYHGHHNYQFCSNPSFPEVSCGQQSGWYIHCSDVTPVARNGPYEWHHSDGAFQINDVKMTGAPEWAEGVNTTIVVSGNIPSKKIVAGVAKWKLYESYVTHFIAQGNSDYFQCTNKGCDPTKPKSLNIHADNSFDLTIDYTMPPSKGRGGFNLNLWGEDQDHQPYDFEVTVSYNYTTGAFRW